VKLLEARGAFSTKEVKNGNIGDLFEGKLSKLGLYSPQKGEKVGMVESC